MSEPWLVPEDTRWFESENGRAAILANSDIFVGACVLERVATDFVAVKYKRLHLISVYLSPNVGIGDFAELLGSLSEYLRTVHGEIIVCGDFNAKSICIRMYSHKEERGDVDKLGGGARLRATEHRGHLPALDLRAL